MTETVLPKEEKKSMWEFHIDGNSKIGIIAVLGIVSFAVTYCFTQI